MTNSSGVYSNMKSISINSATLSDAVPAISTNSLNISSNTAAIGSGGGGGGGGSTDLTSLTFAIN